MNDEVQIEFDNWVLELEYRWDRFQQKDTIHATENEYWMHLNCVKYDREINRLRQFNNPCKSCGLPLHLVKNFEIFELGQVCWLCHDIDQADKHR
jgi:hypothetical protein